MSPHSESEFTRLLAAHANRELDAAGRTALAGRARALGREADVAGIERLHRVFDDERALRRAAMAPLEPRDEADATFARLNAAAAAAEDELRRRFAGGAAAPALRPRSAHRARRAALAAAALLVAAGAWALAAGALSHAPDDLRPPDDRRLQVAPAIVLAPEISAAGKEIAWHAVVGAATYDAAIRDADGAVVLSRPDEHARSLRWQLSAAQYERLKREPGPLLLRVVARDSGGIRVATSGDLVLRVR